MAVIPIIVICRPKREVRVAEIVAGIIRYAIKIVVSLSQTAGTKLRPNLNHFERYFLKSFLRLFSSFRM